MIRRNRNGLKRIGVLALALVIALGSLGVAYAAWTDSVYIEGTVYTGTLDIDIVGVSSTFVYKVPGADDTGFGPETVVHYVYGKTDPYPPSVGTLIASAVTDDTSTVSGDVDSATMTFSGLFPGIDFWADVELMYLGTIPAKISVAEIALEDRPTGGILDQLWELGLNGDPTKGIDPHTYGAWIDGDVKPSGSAVWDPVDYPLGLQLHQFDMVHIALHVRLPQEEQYQNISNLGFSGIITVIQWNEYED
ncbi:MAG: hypothetical protein HQ588_04465 [Deltaproteobacteria bacterium]|nr:hypothetical protein [Deltaproteobacteria bacterium]